MDCPCGSGKTYDECCEPFIRGKAFPETAEQLMRSRYSAYTLQEIPYITDTLHPDHRQDWDEKGAGDWSRNSVWQGLEIVHTEGGGPQDEEGTVEFIASFTLKDTPLQHHERAVFEKKDGRWYFKDGELVKPKQVRRETPKIGRNDPCPCGSGRKYKKCCGA
jgi:SEC-C motif-containing protein